MLMKTITSRSSNNFVSYLRSKNILNSLMLRLTMQLKFLFCHVLKTKIVVMVFITLQSFLVFSQKELTHEVYFDTDKFDIPKTEESRLLIFISSLKNKAIQSISIYGFCDDIGADAYNLKLSQQRANAIKTVFSDNEISEDIIQNVDGKGELLLKVVEEKDINTIRGFNRKVEIKVIENQKNSVENNKTVEEKPIETKPTKLNTVERINSELNVGDKIVFETILFESGYSQVVPKSKKTLDSIATALVNRKELYFTIQGHVCCTKYGRDAVDRKTNEQNLSESRAKYVYDYFLKKGIDKKRMRYVGLRRKFPLGGDPKFDRRVEILITFIAK